MADAGMGAAVLELMTFDPKRILTGTLSALVASSLALSAGCAPQASDGEASTSAPLTSVPGTATFLSHGNVYVKATNGGGSNVTVDAAAVSASTQFKISDLTHTELTSGDEIFIQAENRD